MQFEVMKKNHKKEIVIGVIAFSLIAIVFIVRLSFAKYQTIKNMTIVDGMVNYKLPDFKIMAIYKQKYNQRCTEDNCYEEIEEMPESGYEINTTKTYCELNGSKDNNARIYTDETGQHIISKLTKGDRCYLYFDKKISAGESILANTSIKTNTPNFSKTSCSLGCEETTVGVYKTQDDDGDTYYFRGDVTNNYVKFANKYWRIIRINGDGTIRIIYDGESARANGSTFNADTSAFNTSYNNNMYVGLKYTSGQVHGTGTKSTILGNLEIWYNNNLASYASKIDLNAGFCGDRTPSTSETASNNSGGIGTTNTYYGAYIRLVTNKSPILTCSSEDLYTVTNSSKGNKSLTYPIGLITVDEVSMAGGLLSTVNKSYYLYTGQMYWTLTPAAYPTTLVQGTPAPGVFYIEESGGLYGYAVGMVRGVRPVINLRSDVKLTGTGTMSDPYVVN